MTLLIMNGVVFVAFCLFSISGIMCVKMIREDIREYMTREVKK